MESNGAVDNSTDIPGDGWELGSVCGMKGFEPDQGGVLGSWKA
jgi:hypothetical protein